MTKLDAMVQPARPNMTASKQLLYENEKTGTRVYHVFTSNSSLPHAVAEHITWAYFLVGDDNGYTESGCYVSSEANIRLGEVHEDEESVTIERHGTKTIHFGIQVEVDNMVFKKSAFKPYPTGGEE